MQGLELGSRPRNEHMKIYILAISSCRRVRSLHRSHPLYSLEPLSAPCSPMTNRSEQRVGCICLSPIANLRPVQRVDSVTTSNFSVCLSVCPSVLSVCVSACSFVRGFSSVSFRLASKCNFLISHWGNAVKNLGLGEQADKPSRLGLRGSKVDGGPHPN